MTLLTASVAAIPDDTLHCRVRAAIAAAPAVASCTRSRIRVALFAVALSTAVFVTAASMAVYEQPFAGLTAGVQSPYRLTVVLCALLALTFCSTLLALWRGRDGFGVPTAVLLTAALIVAPSYALLTLLYPVHLAHGSGLGPAPGVSISPWGVRCIAIALVIGVIALLSFAGALRRAAPVSSGVRGAVVGAAAGAWTGLAVFAFCPSGEPQHLLIGHVVPIILFTLLGALTLPGKLRP